MEVVVLDAAEGAVTPATLPEIRPAVPAARKRFSSPAAAAEEAHWTVREFGAAAEAKRLGASDRALETAQAMLAKHFATEGEAGAELVGAKLEGFRPARLSAPGLVMRAQTGDRNVAVALLADPLVLLVVGGEPRRLHWSLLPSGPSVTSRADALRFIRALAAGGELAFRLGDRPLPPLPFGEASWDNENEWRLFEDLATIEEWSGVKLPMPRAVSSEEATTAAQAASWARTQSVPASITTPLTFEATPDLSGQMPDELRLHHRFDIRLLGVDVPLGQGEARIPLRGLEREGGSKSRYTARPTQSDITFALSPPASRCRPARRTQPERITPPEGTPETNGVRHSRFKRRASRRLAEVLAARAGNATRAPRHPGGTAGLVDDIRGE